MLSDAAQTVIAIALISIPTIEFGGRFLQTQLGNPKTIIKSNEMAAYFRAGHAHAGVILILGIVAQIVADSIRVAPTVEWPLRIGFVAAPILMSAGFFLGAPMTETKKPGRLVVLLYAGGIILALSTVGMGVALFDHLTGIIGASELEKPPMPKIYLIYRHTDAHPDVERVIDGLTRAHGAASIVKGVQVSAGIDAYRTLVANAIRDCVGSVVIVGPEFNTQPDALGRRRLDDPDDPLRIEMETALKLKSMMMIIALVGKFELPPASELPRSLRPLTRRGAVPMGAFESFEADSGYLHTGVRKMLDGSAKRAVRNVTIIFIAITLAAMALILFSAMSGAMNAPMP